MKKNDKKEMGRPSTYKEEYVGMVEEYIDQCRDNESEEGTFSVDLPTVEGFCTFIDTAKSTVYDWAKDHSEFSDALGKLKRIQHDKLVNGGLSGRYNSTITKLMMSSNHDYAEKKQTDLTTGGKPITPSDDTAKRVEDVLSKFLDK